MKGRAIAFSAPELAFIEAHKTDYRTDAHKAFVATFGRGDVSLANYAAVAKRNGWLTGRTARCGTGGRRRLYSAAEVAFVRGQPADSRKAMHAAFVAACARDDVSLRAYVALRKNLKLNSGRSGCFPKGHVPANKGRKMPFNAGSAATQFKPGRRPETAKPIGHRAVGKDGYWLVCVAERNPWTGAPTRMVMEHRWRWEQANGLIPDGHVLKSLDGDRTNTDPANWIAIPKGMLPRLSGKSGRNYDQAPDELKPLILATARLEQKVRTIGRARP